MSSAERAVQAPLPVPAEQVDIGVLLALNTANEIKTAPLDMQGLRSLLASSWRSIAVGQGEAVVIAMDHRSAYASPNFQWFKARHDRFAYIDRIIVSEAARRRGLGRFLYEHVFDLARAEGLTRIGCEVNVIPPNPVSDAFHARLGFEEVGRADFPYVTTPDTTTRDMTTPDGIKMGGTKTVRYMERRLD